MPYFDAILSHDRDVYLLQITVGDIARHRAQDFGQVGHVQPLKERVTDFLTEVSAEKTVHFVYVSTQGMLDRFRPTRETQAPVNEMGGVVGDRIYMLAVEKLSPRLAKVAERINFARNIE